MMKFMTVLMSIFTFIFSSQAMAHTDHGLGDGAFHFAYHVVFYGLIVFAAVKAYAYFKRKQ